MVVLILGYALLLAVRKCKLCTTVRKTAEKKHTSFYIVHTYYVYSFKTASLGIYNKMINLTYLL